MTRAVTDTQQETLDAIKRMTRRNGYPPSIPELADSFEISYNAMRQRLHGLKDKGLVTWEHNQARTLRIVGGKGS